MTRAEMLARFRKLVDDTVVPYALSDADALNLLAEGEDILCEETGFFLDFTNYTITTVVGTNKYALDARIIEVRDIWDGSRRLLNIQECDRPMNVGDDYSTAISSPDVYHWQADRESGYITFYETPTSVKTYTMHVWRRPRTRLDATLGEPTLPVSLQAGCMEWAAYQYYSIHDLEMENKGRGEEHYARFRQYVSKGKREFHRVHRTNIYLAPSSLYAVRD